MPVATRSRSNPAAVEKPAKKSEIPPREIIYPKIVVSGVEIPEKNLVIDEAMAKELLGYEEESAGSSFGSRYMFTLGDGRKVRCTNNCANRPFDEGHARKLAQDILNHHWSLNCETIIISESGLTHSGQHRLVGLIMACDMWVRGVDFHGNDFDWRDKWPDMPTIRSLVAFGCSDAPEVTRTLDNVKPRSLADVLFADHKMFGSLDDSSRAVVCGQLDYAIRLLWHRTGAKNDAYAPSRTHSESLDFIERHPRLARAVKHIFDKDGKNKAIKNIIPCGTAAGLLYLMACAESDAGAYDGLESNLDFGLWDKALEFWTSLSIGTGGFRLVRDAVGYLKDADDLSGGTTAEKIAIVVNAWNVWSGGNPLTDKQLGYTYHVDKDGGKRMLGPPVRKAGKSGNGLNYGYDPDSGHYLDECPAIGGIDQGDPDEKRREQDAAERAARKEASDKLKAAAKEAREKGKNTAPAETRAEILDRIALAFPNRLLVWPDTVSGDWFVFGSFAEDAHKLLGGKPPEVVDGIAKLRIAKADVKAHVAKLQKRHVLGWCGYNGSTYEYLGDCRPDGGYTPLPDAAPAIPAPLPTKEERGIKARAAEVKRDGLAAKAKEPIATAKPATPKLKGGTTK